MAIVNCTQRFILMMMWKVRFRLLKFYEKHGTYSVFLFITNELMTPFMAFYYWGANDSIHGGVLNNKTITVI